LIQDRRPKLRASSTLPEPQRAHVTSLCRPSARGPLPYLSASTPDWQRAALLLTHARHFRLCTTRKEPVILLVSIEGSVLSVRRANQAWGLAGVRRSTGDYPLCSCAKSVIWESSICMLRIKTVGIIFRGKRSTIPERERGRDVESHISPLHQLCAPECRPSLTATRCRTCSKDNQNSTSVMGVR
jgi:hypothetical protein